MIDGLVGTSLALVGVPTARAFLWDPGCLVFGLKLSSSLGSDFNTTLAFRIMGVVDSLRNAVRSCLSKLLVAWALSLFSDCLGPAKRVCRMLFGAC